MTDYVSVEDLVNQKVAANKEAGVPAGRHRKGKNPDEICLIPADANIDDWTVVAEIKE